MIVAVVDSFADRVGYCGIPSRSEGVISNIITKQFCQHRRNFLCYNEAGTRCSLLASPISCCYAYLFITLQRRVFTCLWHRTHNAEAAGLLQLEEVKWAALHSNETLRMSAISLLCTDLRITTVPSPAEINLLKSVRQSCNIIL